MDNFKDIFIKDVDVKNNVGSNLSTTQPFFISERTNVSYTYVLKKAERISGVVLLITNDLDTHQSLIEKIAEASFTLIECAGHLSGGGVRALDQFTQSAEILSSMTGSLTASGVIPARSGALILSELTELAKFARQLIGESAVRSRPDLLQHLSLPTPPPPRDEKETALPYPLSSSENIKDIERDTSFIGRGEKEQSDDLKKQKESVKDEKDISVTKKRDRRAVILGMLQKKDSITVKDVSLEVTDCSEKTLQRELLALVAQGILVKHGERRWSAYSLA